MVVVYGRRLELMNIFLSDASSMVCFRKMIDA